MCVCLQPTSTRVLLPLPLFSFFSAADYFESASPFHFFWFWLPFCNSSLSSSSFSSSAIWLPPLLAHYLPVGPFIITFSLARSLLARFYFKYFFPFFARCGCTAAIVYWGSSVKCLFWRAAAALSLFLSLLLCTRIRFPLGAAESATWKWYKSFIVRARKRRLLLLLLFSIQLPQMKRRREKSINGGIFRCISILTALLLLPFFFFRWAHRCGPRAAEEV